MQVGPYVRMRNPARWRRDPAQVWADGLRSAELAEELGFDSVWLTEHHFLEDGYSPSLMPLAAAIAARTSRVRIGTNVLLAPLHHPVRLAEDTASVDLISGGRLVLGLGSGYRPAEFRGYGVERARRGDLTDEVVEVLLQCWNGAPFDHDGSVHSLRGVACSPVPVQQPHPPLYLGGLNPRGLRRFARTPSAEGVAGVPPQALHDLLVTEMETAGRDPASIRYVHLLWVYVGADDDSAWQEAGHHAEYEHEHYRRWWADVGRDVMTAPTRQQYIVAGAAGALGRIREALSHAPGRVSHLVLGTDLAGLPPHLHEESLRRIAADVLPGLHGDAW